MSTASSEVALFGYASTALLHVGFVLYLLFSGRLRGATQRPRVAFVAALLMTAVWAALVLPTISRSGQSDARGLSTWLAVCADMLRYGLWYLFLLTLLGLARPDTAAANTRALRWAAGLCLSAVGLVLLLRARHGLADALSKPELAAVLALPVCGLLMVEQIFRGLGEESRWSAKPMCVGLGCIFAFDIYLYSEALLFGRFDADALSIRGAVHSLAVPFLFIAVRRGSDWIVRLKVSRSAAFYSATLILAGGYLLFMSAIGYYVRFFGGNWGRALQLGLLVAALAFLGMLVFSGSLRSWLRVFVGKHFYSYRYDYREEWLRFTAMLSSKRSPQEMGELIVRGLAKMVECPGGTLWTRAGSEPEFAQSASWNWGQINQTEPLSSSLCVFLQDKGWVVDLDEFRSSPRKYGELALPTWLLSANNGWLVVPLLAGDDLLGFVLLARPLTAIKLNWEVLDLLKTAGGQAAGYLAQMQATEALLEARKFEAFNRMSAFVVHDLKNIVAQLSLMLKNAERLHDNREFQQDMLLTVGSSLEKMKRLMLQLREGATPPGGSRGVELAPILRKLDAMAKAQGRQLEVEQVDRLATRGHDDRLERVLGHLVQNALDATPLDGRVWVSTERASGQVKVVVGDTGAGMSEEFVRQSLFRPFNTTKHSGMGIGSYESFQYVRELGGSIAVESQPGLGTIMTVLLPLFETERSLDLMRVSTR
jgi:putative PEP-CTERM system histidine kinase